MLIAGALTAENLSAQMTGKPPIKITRTKLDFSPQSVRLSETSIQAGRRDVTLEGRLDNILALISPEKTMLGSIRMRSDLLDLDEWSTPIADSPAPEATVQTTTSAPTMIPAYDMDLDLVAKEVIFNGEKIINPVLSGRIRPDQVIIDR
ncbi:MAG: hypothetical protein IPL46_06865 [Saprospiraceae bacterium]|nr:hypothetical protein [Saprospiraceae bacterium]